MSNNAASVKRKVSNSTMLHGVITLPGVKLLF